MESTSVEVDWNQLKAEISSLSQGNCSAAGSSTDSAALPASVADEQASRPLLLQPPATVQGVACSQNLLQQSA